MATGALGFGESARGGLRVAITTRSVFLLLRVRAGTLAIIVTLLH